MTWRRDLLIATVSAYLSATGIMWALHHLGWLRDP